MRPPVPDRIEIAPGLEISRVVTGLWQVADMERGGKALDLDRAAAALGDYSAAGFRCSCNRGINSTRLQGRKRLSSWWTRMSSQPSLTAPVLPGRANK